MQREIAGAREVTLDLPTGATIEDAWTALVARVPELAPGRSSVRFARNGAYDAATSTLGDGDEVAMIPPVSGGAGADPEVGGGATGRVRIIEIRSEPLDA